MALGFVVAAVETDGGLQHQKDIVAAGLDPGDDLGDLVGFRQGLVDGIAEFLHELLQFVVHEPLPFAGDSPSAETITFPGNCLDAWRRQGVASRDVGSGAAIIAGMAEMSSSRRRGLSLGMVGRGGQPTSAATWSGRAGP